MHPPSLIRVFAVHMKKAWVLSYPLSPQQTLRLWLVLSDWTEASLGADSFCRFYHVAAHIYCYVTAQKMLFLCYLAILNGNSFITPTFTFVFQFQFLFHMKAQRINQLRRCFFLCYFAILNGHSFITPMFHMKAQRINQLRRWVFCVFFFFVFAILLS